MSEELDYVPVYVAWVYTMWRFGLVRSLSVNLKI